SVPRTTPRTPAPQLRGPPDTRRRERRRHPATPDHPRRGQSPQPEAGRTDNALAPRANRKGPPGPVAGHGQRAARGRRDVRIVDVLTTVVGAAWRELTFVELVTDDGTRGVGEVRMVNKTDTLLACISELADRHVIGADPFDRETLAFQIQRAEYARP